MRKPPKFPPYPDSNYDAANTEQARVALITQSHKDKKDYKSICRYCHACSLHDTDRGGRFIGTHLKDCPAKQAVTSSVL